MTNLISRFALLTLTAGSLLFCTPLVTEPVSVKIGADGQWERGGKPYFIKGAGGNGSLAEVARRGGNSIRTWGHDGLGGVGGQLDQAQKHGLTVCAGIWLEPECNWFSYKKAEDCDKQKAKVLKIVQQHKDHPALLCWGIGNEAEGDGGNEAFWKQINALALAVKEIDPHHPTFTAVAGFPKHKIEAVNKWAPALDFIGINTYAALRHLRDDLKNFGWSRPWVVTEYGARGFWESPKTAFGTSREQTSTEKANQLRELYPLAIGPSGGCGGGYCFLWGWKQEVTGTWFSLFTQENESTGSVDVLQQFWTGEAPKDKAPELLKLDAEGLAQPLVAGTEVTVKAEARDPEGATLLYSWAIRPEAVNSSNAGSDPEPVPDLSGVIAANAPTLRFAAPKKAGSWRVHLTVRDGRGHVATGNVPFAVAKE